MTKYNLASVITTIRQPHRVYSQLPVLSMGCYLLSWPLVAQRWIVFSKSDSLKMIIVIMVVIVVLLVVLMVMACRHIPTMTKSHHGGNMSVMIRVGVCQWQNPTIHEKYYVCMYVCFKVSHITMDGFQMYNFQIDALCSTTPLLPAPCRLPLVKY